MAEVAAAATVEGGDEEAEHRARDRARDGPISYHGYFSRILLAQGADAPGGAYDFVVKGHMIGGFALGRMSGRAARATVDPLRAGCVRLSKVSRNDLNGHADTGTPKLQAAP